MAITDSETLKIIVEARNNAQQVLNDLNKSLAKTGDATEKADKRMSGFSGTVSNLKRSIFSLKGALVGLGAAFGAWKITKFIKDSTLVAARYRTLGVTLEQIGQRAGYTTEHLTRLQAGLEKTGIAGIETRTILTRMVQAQLDLGRAIELGRVAQNAAVIANLNSSETFQRMLHAIQANSVEILRTIGLNVSFERSYKKFAKTLGLSVSQLTEAQKVQSRFNAVVEAGGQIAGAYESAMSTAGKQMNSFARYTQTFRIAIGKAFEPALAEVVASATTAMKGFIKSVKDEQFQEYLKTMATVIGEQIKDGFTWLINNRESILQATLAIAKGFAAIGKAAVFVTNLFTQSRESMIAQMSQVLRNELSMLETYKDERSKLMEKLEKQDFGFFSTKENIEGSLKNVNERIENTKAKIVKLKDDLDKLSGKRQEQEEKRSYSFNEAASLQFESFLIKKGKKAIQATAAAKLASAFSRIRAKMEAELAQFEVMYDRNLKTIEQYFAKQQEVAKKVYEAEKKLIESKIKGEKDADKKLKLSDRLFAIEKQYSIKILKLQEAQKDEEKKLADQRYEIEKNLEAAKIELRRKSVNVDEYNKAELDALKATQESRLKGLKDAKATSDQINDAIRLNQLERDQLLIEQDKRTSQTRLEIERIFWQARANLVPTENMQGQFKLEIDRLKKDQEERLNTITDAKMTEKERLAAIEEHYRISELEKERVHAEQKKKIQEVYLEGIKSSMANLNAVFGDLYELSGRKTKEFFALQKAVSIAQTIMSTYEAAQKAYNAMSGIPYVGPALGAAAAGTAVAAGMARVAMIKSQTLASGGEVKGSSPTTKSDNIPIKATAGEFMQPVAAVRKYGVDFMESIRRLEFPVDIASQIKRRANIKRPTRYFAEGGIISKIDKAGTGGINTNISVNVNGGSGNPVSDGREVGRMVKIEFNKNLKEQLRPGGLLYSR